MANTYQAEKLKDYTLKIRALLPELPALCGSFFRAIDTQTSVLTRYAYAIDLRGFFHYTTQQKTFFPEEASPPSPSPILRKYRRGTLNSIYTTFRSTKKASVNSSIRSAQKRGSSLPFVPFLNICISTNIWKRTSPRLSIFQSCTKRRLSGWSQTRLPIYWTARRMATVSP